MLYLGCAVRPHALPSQIAKFTGPTWDPPGPRWAPCRPYEPSYQGCLLSTVIAHYDHAILASLHRSNLFSSWHRAGLRVTHAMSHISSHDPSGPGKWFNLVDPWKVWNGFHQMLHDNIGMASVLMETTSFKFGRWDQCQIWVGNSIFPRMQSYRLFMTINGTRGGLDNYLNPYMWEFLTQTTKDQVMPLT